MSYIINTYNGTQLTVIADGTVDNTTELTLVGKNYSGYGTFQNDNFLYLLENFANTTSPVKPITGQLWFDSNTNKLKFYDKNANWRNTSGADISTGEPSYLTDGDFWFDTAKKQLYVYTSTGYQLIGPPQVNTQATTFQSLTVMDTDGTDHNIIAAQVDGSTVFIVSNDAGFQLDTGINAIAGFTMVQPGITLLNTNTAGFTTGTTIPYRFYGTSKNTDTINVTNGAGVIIKDSVQATFGLAGLNDKSSIVARDVNGNIIVNVMNGVATQSNTLKFGNLYVSASNIVPTSTDKSSIVARDSSGDITVNNMYGTASQADTLKVSNYYYGASLLSDADTIAVRDSSGDIYAHEFNGTAIQAKFADLAEKYLPDRNYEPGTVVSVGGPKEITAAKIGDRPIGVISENPAFMMNKDLEGGIYVALKGRVPVKVMGPVQKGDKLVANIEGTASTALYPIDVFAIALESSSDINVKLIEAVIL